MSFTKDLISKQFFFVLFVLFVLSFVFFVQLL